MEFKETDLEHSLTHSYKDGMIDFLCKNPQCFEEAIALSISNKQPYAWRAAWLLWSCIETNDSRVIKHIDTMISSISGKEDGHQRELIKILYEMELNDDQEGTLFDICSKLWSTINKKPSVRFTAFKFLVKAATKYPDLKNELRVLTQTHYLESLSPGVKKSINKMLWKAEI